jgi:ABC-2 type transport system permease protein
MIRSEWIKLWSVRSTYWTLAIGMSLMAAIAGIFAGTADPKHTINPTDALQGGVLAQLAFGVLGVLCIASEYSTGMIRTTFTAVPARRKALLAKGGVLFAVLAVCGQAIAALSFFIARAVFSSRGVHLTISGHDTVLAVAGMGFYICFVVLLRSPAAALSTFFGVVFVLMSIVPSLLPSTLRDDVGKFMFLKVAQAMTQTVRDAANPDSAGLLSMGSAWLVCVGYLLAGIVLPLLVINRRDAK